jgi:enamine deaminase RidA (YjgF/YER057c/UK114 family)
MAVRGLRLVWHLKPHTILHRHPNAYNRVDTAQLTKRMSSKISAVSTKNAPAAMAVYSQAIIANGFVYCSGKSPSNKLLKRGQIPADKSGAIIEGDIKAHTVRSCTNLLTSVEAMHSKFECCSNGCWIEHQFCG